MTNAQHNLVHAVAGLAGAVIGWRAWPAHHWIGAFIGHGIGAGVAAAVIGPPPWIAEMTTRLRAASAAQQAQRDAATAQILSTIPKSHGGLDG